MKSGLKEIEVLNSKSYGDDIQNLLFQYLKKKDKNSITTQLSDKIDEVYEEDDKDKFIESLREDSKTEEEIVKDAYQKTVKQNEQELSLEEKDDKDDKAKGSDYTKRQLMLKVIYEDTLKKYYDLKQKLYKRNIKDDNRLSFSDDEYNKLLLYSKYLKRIDTRFSNISSYKHITEEFKETKAVLNKNVKNEDMYQKHITREHDKQVAENKELEDKMEELSKDIINLDSNDPNYVQKYDCMMDAYVRLDAKLHMNEPNVVKLQVDEERKQEENLIEDKVLGVGYKKQFVSKTYNDKNRVVNKYEISKEKKDGLYYDEKDTISQKQATSIVNAHELVIAESLEAIVEKVKQGDMQGAKAVYMKVKTLASETELQNAIKENKELNFEEVKPKSIKEDSNNIFKTDSLDIAEITQNIEDREVEKESTKEEQMNNERNFIDENLNRKRNKL